MDNKEAFLKQMEGLTEEQLKELLVAEEGEELDAELMRELGLVGKEEGKEEKTLEEGGEKGHERKTEEGMQERKEEVETGTEVKAEVKELEEEPTVEDIISQDPVLRQLSVMTEEERIAWAQTNGAQGLAKLMQLQKLEMQAEIEALKQEAKSVSLEAIIEDWIAEHQDWMSNPEIRDIAMGLDIALLQKRGVSHYSELSVRELREHLKEVEAKVRKIVNSVDSAGEKKEEDKKKEKTVERTGSIGDLPAGGTSSSPAELLEKVANDPMKLEALIERYGKKLDDLIAGLEN